MNPAKIVGLVRFLHRTENGFMHEKQSPGYGMFQGNPKRASVAQSNALPAGITFRFATVEQNVLSCE
jgi:hypothetical protein